MKAGTYTAAAPAKVNLGLAVLTRRGDGFHELETLMARLALADEVRVTVAGAAPAPGEPRIALEVTTEGIPEPAELAGGEENLAFRAAALFLRAYAEAGAAASGPAVVSGPLPRVELTLVKRVPVAAGLGGGSSDAAAVLRLLAAAAREQAGGAGVEEPGAGEPGSGEPGSGERRTAAALAPSRLRELALGLGSDVPFFLGEAPAAVARGRGERLTPIELPQLHLVLVNPGFPLGSADAYRDLVGFTPRLRPERALERLARGTDPGWSNGLQPGVLRAHPQLREVLGALRSAGLKGALMAGSGPTCFGVAESAADAARSAAELAAAHPAWWVRATHTLAGAS